MAIALIDTPKRLEVFTYEDYLNLPDDGERYEIIHGELYMSPALTAGHQRVAGTENRDRTIKLKVYSKFGVQEYWMASEKKETVEVWRRTGKKLIFHALLNRTQILTTPLLPGLEIPLGTIFQRR